MAELCPNEGKELWVTVEGRRFARLPIKTHVITEADEMSDVVNRYAAPHMQEGDILFISEKAVACSQRRAIKMSDIKPRKLAKFLTKFVYKSPYGIGLGIPETMEMALRECGTFRILYAAFISAVGKLLGRRGWFYKAAGYKAESIDGPTPNTLPPYNEYVVLGPERPDKVARELSEQLGHPCIIIDVNDLAGKILGRAGCTLSDEQLLAILKDNPLGQSAQQTPMGLIRPEATEGAA